MKRGHVLSALCLGVALSLTPSLSFSQESGAQQDAKTIGHATRKAASATGRATEGAAKTTGHGVKKVFHLKKKGTRKARYKKKQANKSPSPSTPEGSEKK